MNVRLLRGRVIVRPIQHEYGQKLIVIPATSKVDDPREDTERAKRGGRSLGRGIVVAMGPPAFEGRSCRACGGVRQDDKVRSARCAYCKGAGKVNSERESVPGFKVGDEVLFRGQHVSRNVLWDDEICKAVAQDEVEHLIVPDENPKGTN